MEGHHGATTRLLLCITQQDVLSLCPPHCMHEYQVPVRAIKDVEFGRRGGWGGAKPPV